MRTKTLFIAAAALAAGVASSMAQNVYSVNIVGYVSAPNPINQYIILANPLDNGTNDLYSLLPSAPNNSVVQVLAGGVLQNSTKNKGNWLPTDFIIPPGNGFFYKAPSAGTTTFVGSSPTTNNAALAGSVTVLAGSTIPFSGTLTDSGPNTLNLGPTLPNNSTVSVLVSGVLQTSTKNKGNWLPTNPTLGVAQGYYIKPASAVTWAQGLQ